MEEHTELPKTGVIKELPVRCGNCYHFAKERARLYPDICSNLGILKIGRICHLFLANVNSLSLKTDTDKTFAELLRKIPSSKLAEYAALVSQERITRRLKFYHGQEVYIRLYPDEYVSNYVRVWIMLAEKNRVIVQGIKSDFRGSFLRTSILTQEDFEVKKRALIARKRIIDPKLSQYTQWKPKIKDPKNYTPPIIDDIPRPNKLAPVKLKTKKYSGVISLRGKNVK